MNNLLAKDYGYAYVNHNLVCHSIGYISPWEKYKVVDKPLFHCSQISWSRRHSPQKKLEAHFRLVVEVKACCSNMEMLSMSETGNLSDYDYDFQMEIALTWNVHINISANGDFWNNLNHKRSKLKGLESQ